MSNVGYYQMPEYSVERLQIAGRSDVVIEMNRSDYDRNVSSVRSTLKTIAVQTDDNTTSTIKLDRYIIYQLANICLEYIRSQENIAWNVFVAVVIISIVCAFMYLIAEVGI